MLIEPEISSFTVVLIGDFKPGKFNTGTFLLHHFLKPEEIENVKVIALQDELSQIEADSFQLSVTQQRFVLNTAQSSILIHDFVLRLFREVMPYVPIYMLGINRLVHFSVGSREARDEIGYILAPPSAWGDWEPGIRAKTDKLGGGLTSLVMQQAMQDDRKKGWVKAHVQPSTKIRDNAGIYVEVNDHYEVEDKATTDSNSEIMQYLEDNFDKSLKRSEWIIDQLMKLKK